MMFSEEECLEMIKYIDENNSGEVLVNEFISKLATLIYKSYPSDK